MTQLPLIRAGKADDGHLPGEGYAVNTGFSFHDDADTLDMILTEHPEVDFVQLQINYLDWEDAVAQSGRCYEVARKHGKYMTVMEPVKGGTLANLQGEAGTVFEEFYRKRGGKPIRYRQFLYIQLSVWKNHES